MITFSMRKEEPCVKQLNATIITDKESIEHQLIPFLEKNEIHVEVLRTPITDIPFSHFVFIGQDIADKMDYSLIDHTTNCIGILEERAFDIARQWMQQGIKDIIVLPEEIDKLEYLIVEGRKQKEEKRKIADSTLHGGKVYTFYSANGGSGKTVLSSMLAQCLKTQFEKKVILIDFNAQIGGVETLMALEPVRNYADLLPVIDELSIHHIQNVTTLQEQTELEVLTGPKDPEKAEIVSQELVRKILQICQEYYDYVIVDAPSSFNIHTYTAIEMSSKVFYPLTTDALAIRGFKQVKAFLERLQLLTNNHLYVLINRVHTKNEFTVKDIKNIIHAEIIGQIREDYFGLQSFINMGMPFYTKKGRTKQLKQTIDMYQLAESLVTK